MLFCIVHPCFQINESVSLVQLIISCPYNMPTTNDDTFISLTTLRVVMIPIISQGQELTIVIYNSFQVHKGQGSGF